MPLFRIAGKQPARFTNPEAIDSLAPPPWKPNCATSHADAKANQRVAPLTFPGPPDVAFARLRESVVADGGQIAYGRPPRYLWATYSSSTFGFVDDLELLISETDGDATTIDVRSASRVGIGDFGVNRARVERLRTALES